MREDPRMFEKAINIEHEMLNLSAISTTRFFDRDGKAYIRPEQSSMINKSIQEFLTSIIGFTDIADE